jgi:hypothetical protein
LEGDDLQELLARARAEGGEGSRILGARKVRRSRLMGLVAHETYQVVVRLPAALQAIAPAPGEPHLPADAVYRPTVEAVPDDGADAELPRRLDPAVAGSAAAEPAVTEFATDRPDPRPRPGWTYPDRSDRWARTERAGQPGDNLPADRDLPVDATPRVDDDLSLGEELPVEFLPQPPPPQPSLGGTARAGYPWLTAAAATITPGSAWSPPPAALPSPRLPYGDERTSPPGLADPAPEGARQRDTGDESSWPTPGTAGPRPDDVTWPADASDPVIPVPAESVPAESVAPAEVDDPPVVEPAARTVPGAVAAPAAVDDEPVVHPIRREADLRRERDRTALRELGLPAAWARRLQAGDRFAAILRMLRSLPDPDLGTDAELVVVVGPPAVVRLEAHRTAGDLPVGEGPRPVVVVPLRPASRRDAALARAGRPGPRVVALEAEGYEDVGEVRRTLDVLDPDLAIAVVAAGVPVSRTRSWIQALGRIDAVAVDGASDARRPADPLRLGLPVVRLDGIPVDRWGWAALLCGQLEARESAL